MKKIFLSLLLLAAVTMYAQDIPASFPRKFVIEHFTGDQCGYCPGGMYSITDYILEEDSTAIWVSHHYGYNTDEIVSSDVIGMTYGSLFDATQTMVAPMEDGNTQVQVVSWYDNENSYTSQMVRTIKYFAELA